jgi:hypothetical protein
MNKFKQPLIDIGVVLALPILVFLGSYFWSPSGDTALLSVVPTPQAAEFGAASKSALDRLNSINMDTSLFADPVYQSLQEFHIDIAPATLGRPYPFTPPDAVRNAVPLKTKVR